jgi:Clp protease
MYQLLFGHKVTANDEIHFVYPSQATDLEISAKLMLHTKETLNTYMAAFCDQTVDKLRLDTDRDFYMTPQEALSYGLIDEVIQHKNMIKTPKIPSLRVSQPLRSFFILTILIKFLFALGALGIPSACDSLTFAVSILPQHYQVPPPLSIYDLGNVALPPPSKQPQEEFKKTWS